MKKFLLIAAALGFTSLSYTAVAQQDEKIEQPEKRELKERKEKKEINTLKLL